VAALGAATGFTLWVAVAVVFLVLVIPGGAGVRLPTGRRRFWMTSCRPRSAARP